LNTALNETGGLSRIHLTSLTSKQVVELCQDTFHLDERSVEPLAEMLIRKTSGNPFHINEFLRMLYSEELIDYEKGHWHWDLVNIESKCATENVIELLVGNMRQLSDGTQQILQVASVLGNQFTLSALEHVSTMASENILLHLEPALYAGILIQQGGDFRYRFGHDRMQQAAYELVPEVDRSKLHLRVGYNILNSGEKGLSDTDCFSVVEHLNHCHHLIKTTYDRQLLAQLNLRAAELAYAASAWHSVTTYSQAGMELLDQGHWQKNPDTSEQLYSLNAESLYLTGLHRESEQIYQLLTGHLRTDLSRAEVCAERVIQFIGRGEWDRAIQFCTQGLEFVGIELPDSEDLEAALRHEEAIQAEKGWILSNAVLQLPEMHDPKIRLGMRLMVNLAVCYSIKRLTPLDQYIAVKGCNLIVEYGRSESSAMILCCRMLFYKKNKDPRSALALATQAKLLAESYSNHKDLSNCYNLIAAGVWHFQDSYKSCIELHMKGIQAGLNSGDIARAAMNACNILFAKISMGEIWPVLQSESSEVLSFLSQHKVFHPFPLIVSKLSSALLKESQNIGALDDQYFESSFLAKVNQSFHGYYLEHFRCQLAFWSDDWATAFQTAKKLHQCEPFFPLSSFGTDHLFFYAFLVLVEGNPSETWVHREVEYCLSLLTRFADTNALNFRHLCFLLQAEQARYPSGAGGEAGRLYKDAIEGAKRGGFLQFQALANERAGEYWLAQGFEFIGVAHLREAFKLYQIWGCNVRLAVLRSRYKHLFPQSKAVMSSFPDTESSTSDTGSILDMASVMKSVQAISREIRVEQLAAKVLEIIVESSGATSGALLLMRNNRIKLLTVVAPQREVQTQVDPRGAYEDWNLPGSVIQYVHHTDEMVHIEDLLITSQFSREPYFLKNDLRSVLCMPVVYQQQSLGVLYLESNLCTGAFTKERLEVIKLLLVQAAIAFDNAMLFEEVQSFNRELETKIQQRTEALHTAVGELEVANNELSAFSYSVSHDLKGPVNVIQEFSDMILNDNAADLTPEVRRITGRINYNALKMRHLIDGLLTLSRVQRKSAHFDRVDLSSLVTGLNHELQEQFPQL
ncbi:MAG: GAF domain-containing protein, partial [Pseudomonadales bacterium]|nr:GAF domain-containing protein [Pseudomonadales bacterium]